MRERIDLHARELQPGDVLMATSRVVRSTSRVLREPQRSVVIVTLYGEGGHTRRWNAQTSIAVWRDRAHAERVCGALALFEGNVETALAYYSAHAARALSENLDTAGRLARLVVTLAREVQERHSAEAYCPDTTATPRRPSRVIRP